MESQHFDYSDYRDYAWNYFKAHAEARLTTFRFYLVFCTLIFAGMIAAPGKDDHPEINAALAFLLAFRSFVYWKVDIRHKQIIKHAEAALMYLECQSSLPDENGKPHILKLFQHEAHETKTRKHFPKSLSLNSHFSYSTCVNMVFLLFGLSGIAAGIGFLSF